MNKMNYENFYNDISSYFHTHDKSYKVLKFTYIFLPYFIMLSYVFLLTWQGYLFLNGISNSSDADILTFPKLVLTPLTVFVFISVIRECIDAKRPYEKYNIKPLIPKNKKGHSMPSRHVISITIIAMSWLYVNIYAGIFLLLLSVIMAAVRVVAGVHFPKDVIAGFIISILWGIIGLWIV